MTTSCAELQISQLTREYVKVPVRVTENGESIDPTDDPVEFSFPARGDTPATWTSGSWETTDRLFLAKVLVGPTTAWPLPAGRYDVWVRITSAPEQPVRLAGHLLVV